MLNSKMKKLVTSMIALILCLSSVSAMACTAIYVGSDLTADGTTMFARSEDISNSYNKLFYVSPAGKHTAGEEYAGCYGFTYTFTKSSYGYTAFSDDYGAAASECPDCGGTHAHTPYEAGGTNEMGVTVSATETIGCSDAIYEADPYVDTGIEEAEIPTVLLSEAATAKEAVDLLLSIYDTAGCAGGAGLFIADDKEVWYVENASGTQYVALKLSSSMAFAQPNMSIIGLIDLDDTENVIASENLIAVAEKAGSYVGDKEANTIDYVASYNADQSAGSRMVSALKFFNAETAKDEPTAADYTISNVNAEGAIVPMYTSITLDHAYTVDDFVNYYHIAGIGSNRNLETHIFAISAQDGLTDTMEWVAMDDAALSVFVPYYPMLTTDTYEGYQLSTLPAEFAVEKPENADVAYPTTKYQWNENHERVPVEGYCTLPADWAGSVYWTMDALSNLYETGSLTDEQKAAITDKLEALQTECIDAFAQLNVETLTPETATAASAELAAKVHAACVELVNAVK